MLQSTIRIATAESIMAGLELLSPPAGDEVTLLPSSLRRNDQAARELRDYLRQRGSTSHLVLPEPMLAAMLKRSGGDWRDVELPVDPTRSQSHVSLPSRLVDGLEVWTIVDIEAVSGRGPYVLDLLGRYSNPQARLRTLGSRHRADMAVSFLQAFPIQRHIIVRHFDAFELVATSTDPIAAELLALSLVDEDLTRDHQVAGPWEDDLVQRATERELGARVPIEICVDLVGARSGPPMTTLARVLGRIGLSIQP